MAAGALPKPGTKYGPCKGTCAHTDCAATRAMAERNCVCCADTIGYERLFYREHDGHLIHAACAEER